VSTLSKIFFTLICLFASGNAGAADVAPTIERISAVTHLYIHRITASAFTVYAGSATTSLTCEYGPTLAYGLTQSYGPEISANTTLLSGSVILTDLLPGTLYHYRFKAQNSVDTTYSSDATFTTRTLPVFETLAATNVTDLTVTLNGSVTPPASSLSYAFEWGTSALYGNTIRTFGNEKQIILRGLLPSTTYHYRFKAFNIYEVFYGSDVVFTTSAAATPPTIISTASPSVSLTSASLRSEITTGSSPTTLSFQYGTTTAYGSETPFPETLAVSTEFLGSVNITNLIPGTIYHYRAKAVNDQGTTYSTNQTFTTLTIPTLITTPATGVTDAVATLNGSVNPGGGSVQIYFDWGLTEAYGNSSGATSFPVITGSASVARSYNVGQQLTSNRLLPTTTYHYRIRGTDASNNTYYGSDSTFTTGVTPVSPATISGVAATYVAIDYANLTAAIISGSSPVRVSVEYGLSSAYGLKQSVSVLQAWRSASGTTTLPNLTPGTTYHFRYVASSLEETIVSPNYTFTTAPLTVATQPATLVTDMAATLNGLVSYSNQPSVRFEWGRTTSYGSTATPTGTLPNGPISVARTAVLNRLLPNTVYHFRFVASGVYGADQTFTTSPAQTPPSLGVVTTPVLRATMASINITNAFSGSSVAQVSCEYGLTPSYGSEALLAALPFNTTSTAQGVLTGLVPGTPYFYRVKITNAQGTAYSANATFTTLVNVPAVTTEAATSVGELSATLNAIANAEAGTGVITFELGTSTAYGTTITPTVAPVVDSTNLAVSGLASKLLPSTTYHYRVKVVDGLNNLYLGQDQTFVTTAAVTPASVTTGSTQSLTAQTVTLFATDIQTRGLPSTLHIDYGPTISYGSQVTYASTLPPHIVGGFRGINVSSLQPSTLYHYRARLVSDAGTVVGQDATFTSRSVAIPTTGGVTAISDLSATLNGSLSVASDVGAGYSYYLEYGPTTAYGSRGYGAYAPTGVSAVSAIVAVEAATTYHYRLVAQANSATIYGEDLTFTSSPPATPPQILSSSAVTTATTARVSASVKHGSSPTQVIVEYGLTADYGTEVAYGSLIIGLQPLTVYHYRLKATNAEGVAVGPDRIFGTSPLLPTTIETFDAISIDDRNATLTALWGRSTPVRFEYGVSTSYGSQVEVSGNEYAISATISDLLPDTIYHYRAVATTTDGTFTGEDLTFRTLPPTNARPVITGTSISRSINVVSASATVRAGDSPVTVFFEYGSTTAYGSQVPTTPAIPRNTVGTVSAYFASLLPATEYHYRIGITDSVETSYSQDYVFTTVGIPTVTTDAATSVTETAAVLQGSANTGGSSLSALFEYGLTPAYGSYSNNTTGNPYSQALTNLQPGTTYHYRLKLSSTYPVAYYGEDRSFTTLGTSSAAPTIGPAGTPASLATSTYFYDTGKVWTGTRPVNISFEYGVDMSYGNTQFVLSSPAQTEVQGQSTRLLGLTPATTYYYRTVVNDGLTTYYGASATFNTPSLVLRCTIFPATQVRTTSATLNGTCFSNADTNNISFEYGTDLGYGTTISGYPATVEGSIYNTNNIIVSVGNLLPATTYHYRLVNRNPNGDTFSEDMTFTTSSETLPSAQTGPATLTEAPIPGIFPIITNYTLTLRGTVNPRGNPVLIFLDSDNPFCSFPVSPQLVSGTADIAVSSTCTFSSTYPINLLGSVIKYRIRIVSSLGTFYGQDMKLTLQPPSVVGTSTSFNTANPRPYTATLSGGATSSYSLAFFEFGLTTDYGSTIPAIPSSFLAYIGTGTPTALLPNTTYHFRAAVLSDSGTSYGKDATFTTGQPDAVIGLLPATNITSTGATLLAQVTEAGVSDELVFFYGTQGRWDFSKAGSPYLAAASGVTDTSAVLTGLTPGTTYRFGLGTRRLNPSGASTFTTLTILEDWRLLHFSDTVNSGPGADLATPDQDGIPNLIKYAFLLPPGTPAADEVPAPELRSYLDGNRLSVIFKRSPARTEAAITVEVADTPTGPWTAVGTVTNGAPCVGPGLVAETTLSPNEIQVEVRDVVTASATGKRFMRLRVAR
jgi:phosphodiesterase/alkaline phosphatase D-like protein